MSNSPRLQNLYIAKLTTQDRPCFVCSKFTNVVLTSVDNSNTDWFYICRSHLGDFNFCSKIGGSPKPAKSTVDNKKESYADRKPESDSVVELVSSIGSAWKSWRGGKKSDEKEEEKKKDDEKKKEEEEEENSSSETSTPTTTSAPVSPVSTPDKPVRFVIQRDYFYLRQREYLKKIQKKEATEKLKTINFPEVPKNVPTLQK